MRPASVASSSSGAVNVVCVDVNTLLRAAREKGQRERLLLDDRPVLGRTVDELLEEEIRGNTQRAEVPSEETQTAEAPAPDTTTTPPTEGATSASPYTAADGYFIKGCPRDATVLPPLSPADATILQEVLRNPERTLASGEHVLSRPSWTARQQASSLATSRPSSSSLAAASPSGASLLQSVPEVFRVVPHTEERFRSHRRSHVALEPYAHPRHSSAASHSVPKRESVTQTFMDDTSRRASRASTERWRAPSYSAMSHSPVALESGRRRSTQQSPPPSAQPPRAADAIQPGLPSASSSTVDVLVFGDDRRSSTVLYTLPWSRPSGLAVDLNEDLSDSEGRHSGRTGGGAALARQYLHLGRSATKPTSVATDKATPASGLSPVTPVPSQSPTVVGGTRGGPEWEHLPPVKRRTHNITAFQSTLVTANAVQVQEEDWRHQQLRSKQMVSKPVRVSAATHGAGGAAKSTRCVPAAFRRAATLSESQPKTRRPKRQ